MSTKLQNAVTIRDHMIGSKTAPLQLVEYGDYQCPSCGDAFIAVNKVLRQMPKSIAFVFRNFPLTDIHPDAFDAALAAEAAGLQNKFWEMYDQLYQNQDQLSGYQLFAYAKGIGLDMVRFEQDIQSQALASKVEADMERGVKSGVSGTPTFFINGEKYEGDWQGDELIQYLKSLL